MNFLLPTFLSSRVLTSQPDTGRRTHTVKPTPCRRMSSSRKPRPCPPTSSQRKARPLPPAPRGAWLPGWCNTPGTAGWRGRGVEGGSRGRRGVAAPRARPAACAAARQSQSAGPAGASVTLQRSSQHRRAPASRARAVASQAWPPRPRGSALLPPPAPRGHASRRSPSRGTSVRRPRSGTGAGARRSLRARTVAPLALRHPGAL